MVPNSDLLAVFGTIPVAYTAIIDFSKAKLIVLATRFLFFRTKIV
jgi:hypothetical protein